MQEFWNQETKNQESRNQETLDLFYLQVRESPATLNIPTPNPAPDRGGPAACLGGPVACLGKPWLSRETVAIRETIMK